MKGCVACNNLWPWPISSRSFGLGFENRVRSVASTVLDGFFPYLVQMISSMRRCVACDNLWPWPISSRSFDLDFENRVRSVMFSVLDRLFPYLPQIITTIRGCVEGARQWHRLICLVLAHLPLVLHICVGEMDQHWFMWWLVAFSAPSHYLNLLSIVPLGTNFSETSIKIQNFSFMKMHLKISSAKRQPFYPRIDEIKVSQANSRMCCVCGYTHEGISA